MNLKELLDLAKEKAKEERYKTYGVYEVGEPTNEDYIKAFQVSGSGVSKEFINEIMGVKNKKQESSAMFKLEDIMEN